MLCNKCGKNNPFGVGECTYCGAPMSATSACGGFADILTYQPQTPQPTSQNSLANQQNTTGQTISSINTSKTEFGREAVLRRQLAKQQKLMRMIFPILIVLFIGIIVLAGNLASTVDDLHDKQDELDYTIRKLNDLTAGLQNTNHLVITPGLKDKVQQDVEEVVTKSLELVQKSVAETSEVPPVEVLNRPITPPATPAPKPTSTPLSTSGSPSNQNTANSRMGDSNQ